MIVDVTYSGIIGCLKMAERNLEKDSIMDMMKECGLFFELTPKFKGKGPKIMHLVDFADLESMKFSLRYAISEARSCDLERVELRHIYLLGKHPVELITPSDPYRAAVEHSIDLGLKFGKFVNCSR